MKTYKYLMALMMVITLLSCTEDQQATLPEKNDTSVESGYNEALANELGADEYGMRKYVMAFLKAGPNRDQDSVTAANLQRAHLDNIQRLADEGKLVLAGPFMDDGEIRGIYIFNVTSLDEARKLTETDPAIIAGRLEMELHTWYGSAAVMKVNDIHSTLSKTDL